MGERFAGIERRKYSRIPSSFLVVYRVTENTEGAPALMGKDLVAVMHDISEGGISIFTNHDIPETCGLSLRFTIINLGAVGDNRVRTIDARGSVRYRIMMLKGERRIGIGFDLIDETDRTAIAELKKTSAI